jgi:hypothetical protein
MSAGLSQVIPIFGEINSEVRLRPENFGGDPAARARKRNILRLRMRFDATSTAHALKIASDKSMLGSTFSSESDPIVVS